MFGKQTGISSGPFIVLPVPSAAAGRGRGGMGGEEHREDANPAARCPRQDKWILKLTVPALGAVELPQSGAQTCAFCRQSCVCVSPTKKLKKKKTKTDTKKKKTTTNWIFKPLKKEILRFGTSGLHKSGSDCSYCRVTKRNLLPHFLITLGKLQF